MIPAKSSRGEKSVSWVDIVIAVVLVIFMFSGLRQGIIKSVLFLVGLSLGLTLAGRYSAVLAPRLAFIPHSGAASTLAFAIVLVGVLVIAGILGSILTKVASAMMLGWLNRFGGAVFGLFTGAVFAGAATLLWLRWLGPDSAIGTAILLWLTRLGPNSAATLVEKFSNAIKGSFLATLLVDKFPLVLSLLPPEFDVLRRFFK